MRTKLLPKIVVLLLCVGIAGCKSGTKKGDEEGKNDTMETARDTSQAVDVKETGKTSILLPSPLQIATIFQESGLSFISGLTNATESAPDYISRTSKLMNLGVYSADLSYCILNDQSQKASKYLKTVRELSQEVGMAGVFNSNKLFKRFEKNLDNRDSVLNIMVEIQENIDSYLNQNQQQDKSMVIFTGAWIEGMYIGMKAIENQDNKTLTVRLIEQLTILEDLVRNLKSKADKSPEMDKVIGQLESLDNEFKAFVEEKRKEEKPEKEISITYEDLEDITGQIEKVRNNIVEV